MELDLRGSPEWQIRGYLERLGGRSQPDGAVIGPGWEARLMVGEHSALGVQVPRVVVTFRGDPDAVSRVEAALRLRAFRAGG